MNGLLPLFDLRSLLPPRSVGILPLIPLLLRVPAPVRIFVCNSFRVVDKRAPVRPFFRVTELTQRPRIGPPGTVSEFVQSRPMFFRIRYPKCPCPRSRHSRARNYEVSTGWQTVFVCLVHAGVSEIDVYDSIGMRDQGSYGITHLTIGARRAGPPTHKIERDVTSDIGAQVPKACPPTHDSEHKLEIDIRRVLNRRFSVVLADSLERL